MTKAEPASGSLIEPDQATQREVMRLWRQVIGLDHPRRSMRPVDTAVKPHDADSGLVEREWVRTSRKGGTTTERTLEGKHVEAAWIDRQGEARRAAGHVTRDASGQLVIESRADGTKRQTPVPRDSSVELTPKSR